jgi:hypothetical protein
MRRCSLRGCCIIDVVVVVIVTFLMVRLDVSTTYLYRLEDRLLIWRHKTFWNRLIRFKTNLT